MIQNPYKEKTELNFDKSEQICFAQGATNARFLPNGDIFEIMSRNVMFNQYLGNNAFGAASNIFLRVYEKGKVVRVYPLRGIWSESKLQVGSNGILWYGQAEDISYKLEFKLANENTWFWRFEADGAKKEFDLLYVQDIGLASKGAVTNNELYLSQYVDQKVFETANGYAVACRQNQNHGGHPYIYQGALNTKIVGFSTDASQLFGTSYRLDNIPKLLFNDLPSKKYQFEQSCTGLQTQKLSAPCSLAFFARVSLNYSQAISEPENLDEITQTYTSAFAFNEQFTEKAPVKLRNEFFDSFASEPFRKKKSTSISLYAHTKKFWIRSFCLSLPTSIFM